MDISTAVQGRRSIRNFRREPVDKEVIARILDQARWAPSWGNTQSWIFYVLTGEPLEEFRAANRRRLLQGAPFAPDVPMHETWPEPIKRRYGELGKVLLTALGVAREDKEGRARFYAEMADLFGAPYLLVACLPRAIRVEYGLFDLGLIVENICLLAHGEGLGTCIMAAAVGYPDLLRQAASIGDDLRIVMAVALGWPNSSAPVNNFLRPRLATEEFVHWVGF